ncbi:MAG TPA: alpha/beta hydrolase fold domain-containing protein [Burkholderiales bacterium]|nr:alpha/beta hydrolase fold domain-containing protein [Burkholderiales bacterium]
MNPHLPMANLSEPARAEMARIGPIWGRDIQAHREIVFETYLPLLRQVPDRGFRATRDIAYGSHDRQKLDVYQPDGAGGAPVVMFIHGGAFIRGAKDLSDQIYSNVPRYFAGKGLLGINVGYRLAPEAQYPQASRDLAAAVAWAQENVEAFGGDPRRIYLVGHSAGGTHAATYLADPEVRDAGARDVAGLVLLSARLRIEARPDNPNAGGVRAYYGDDANRYERCSPVTHAANLTLPTFIVVCEYDNPLLDVYGVELAHRMAVVRGRCPRVLRLTRHNHISVVAHFNSGEEILGLEILDFIERGG